MFQSQINSIGIFPKWDAPSWRQTSSLSWTFASSQINLHISTIHSYSGQSPNRKRTITFCILGTVRISASLTFSRENHKRKKEETKENETKPGSRLNSLAFLSPILRITPRPGVKINHQ